MARQPSSGRLPAFGTISQAQRDEIARCYETEDALVIGLRLGIPAKAVKFEIKRIRRETPSTRLPAQDAIGRASQQRSRASTIAKALLPLALGGTFLGFAIRQRSSAEAARVGTVERAPGRAQDTKSLYAEIDSGNVDPAHVARALRDADEELRLAGIRAYTRFPPDTRDPEPLVQQLNFEPERLRLAAIQGVGILGDARAVPALASIVCSPRSVAERGLALDALARIADDSAIYPLISALTDSIASIRLRAFNHLTKRLNTSLNCTPERLAKEPEVVRDIFKGYWKELGQ